MKYMKLLTVILPEWWNYIKVSYMKLPVAICL